MPATADRRAHAGARSRWIGLVRVAAAIACVGLVAVALLLMLADRAPGALRHLSDRIDQSERPAARIASDAPIPQSDLFVHIVVWGAVTATAGIAVWSRRRLAATAAVVLSASMLIEGAQDHLTQSRSTQLGDAVGNLIGVALGTAVVATCYIAASGRRRRNPPEGPRTPAAYSAPAVQEPLRVD